jgi:site-specific recombinase XerD
LQQKSHHSIKRRHARAAWAAVRHQHNVPRHLGELTIRVAINRNAKELHDAAPCPGYGQNQTSERKTMAKKRAPKRRAWNKGLEVGKRDGFTPDQVKRIRSRLADRGVPGLRDLALFSTAIDMLHGQDLLALVVGDVQRRNGSMRPVIEVARARRMPPVRCALSNASTKALEKWITASGKKFTDYLFPGRGVESRHPMGQRQLNRLLKLWVVEAGLDPSDYSVESLRRTKALHILKGTGDLQTVRALLGHARIESTARYLGLKTKADPIEDVPPGSGLC